MSVFDIRRTGWRTGAEATGIGPSAPPPDTVFRQTREALPQDQVLFPQDQDGTDGHRLAHAGPSGPLTRTHPTTRTADQAGQILPVDEEDQPADHRHTNRLRTAHTHHPDQPRLDTEHGERIRARFLPRRSTAAHPPAPVHPEPGEPRLPGGFAQWPAGLSPRGPITGVPPSPVRRPRNTARRTRRPGDIPVSRRRALAARTTAVC